MHVIAPPGSGKTVLGLEVVLRIGSPALILAPTIAIRNQWVQKFCELFLQTDITPDWISCDVRKPTFLTVVTYQGLHAACNNLSVAEHEAELDDEEVEVKAIAANNRNLEKILAGLNAQRIKTIVTDEAHHLKNEWWNTLMKIKDGIDPIIVGLTATPPYDVSAVEWQRYLELNGPIDVEILVPELVIEGDLCPHQDYVYLSYPTNNEAAHIREFRLNVETIFRAMLTDEVLTSAMEIHPAWIDPAANLDWIYSNMACYSACLIYLNAVGREIPASHTEIVDNKELKIPAFDYEWAEALLHFYLFGDKERFKEFKTHQKEMETRLRRCGALENKQVNFLKSKPVTGSLATSVSKLDAIKHITDLEYLKSGHELRLVILTDLIRREFYAHTPYNNFELNKIGVISIFEKLRRENTSGVKIGILTGSIVVIPQSAYANFQSIISHLGLRNIVCKTIPFDAGYLLVEECEQLKNSIVSIITRLFEQGDIEVLIGTKSLLGEGWDAPSVNSLILASFVGSFVLSNQMRGRAIRTKRNDINKTGNIWHLCCIDPTVNDGGEDMDMLKRRFKGFVGINVKRENGIENGLARLDIPEVLNLEEAVHQFNKRTFGYAGDREALKEKWHTALKKGVTLTEEIKVPFTGEREYQATKKLYYHKTIKNLIAALCFGLLDYVLDAMDGLDSGVIKTRHSFYIYIAIVGIIGILLFGRRAFNAFRLYLKYRDIDRDILKIGVALVNTLSETGLLSTDRELLSVNASVDKYGAVYCHLDGGSTYEKSAFINMLHEIIKPVDNPRYVIIRKNIFLMFIKQRDFHSVPEYIGKNKNPSWFFKQQWEQYVGRCDLVFTRTPEGRQMLLKARMASLAAQFEPDNTERVSKWK